MVMTQRVAPRASMMGLACSLAIAAAGVLVMPGLACPPEDGKPGVKTAKHDQPAGCDTEKAQAEKKAGAKAAMKADAKAKIAAERRAASSPGVSFFGEAPALDAMRAAKPGHAPQPAQAGDRGDLEQMLQAVREKEETLRRTESRLREMEQMLKQMERGQQNKKGKSPGSMLTPAPGAVTIVGVPDGSVRSWRAAGAPQGGVAGLPGAYTLSTTPSPRAQAARIAGQEAARAYSLAVDGQSDARAYVLSEGKLEALTALMSRSDVPVLVQQEDGRLIVHGSPDQHRTFAAFVALINPEGHGALGGTTPQATALSGMLGPRALVYATGKAQAEQELRAQSQALRSTLQGLTAQYKIPAQQSEELRRRAEVLRQRAEQLREKEGEREDPADDHDEESGVPDDSSPEGLQAALGSGDMLVRIESIESEIEALDNLSDELDAKLDVINETIEALDRLVEVEPADFEIPAMLEIAPEAPTTDMPPLAEPATPADPTAPAEPAEPAAPAPPTEPATPATSASSPAPAAPAPAATPALPR